MRRYATLCSKFLGTPFLKEYLWWLLRYFHNLTFVYKADRVCICIALVLVYYYYYYILLQFLMLIYTTSIICNKVFLITSLGTLLRKVIFDRKQKYSLSVKFSDYLLCGMPVALSISIDADGSGEGGRHCSPKPHLVGQKCPFKKYSLGI